MDADHIQDIFSAFGRVSVRRMFGGAGIYCDGTMFGLCADGVIYLKADDALIVDFQKAGSAPFGFVGKGGRRVLTSYWQLPDDLYDDREALAAWAKRALAVAHRAATAKGRPARRRPKAAGKPRGT